MSDKLREDVARLVTLWECHDLEGNVEGKRLFERIRDALADSADAPPEVTEEIYKAAYDAWWDWLNAGRGSGFESVKVAIRAAFAAVQLDMPCIQKGCGKPSGHEGQHTDGTLPGHVTAPQKGG